LRASVTVKQTEHANMKNNDAESENSRTICNDRLLYFKVSSTSYSNKNY